MKPLDATSSFRGSARFNQVLRLFSELPQARASRQLLCIHTNVLPFLCLESALIRLKECSFFRFQVEGGHGPFRGLVAPLRARLKIELAQNFRQSDFSYRAILSRISPSFNNLPHASELVILERLLDFRAAVHHERAVADDRFGNWLAVHHQELGVGLRFHGDAVASASKDCQVTFACITLAVDSDFAAQDEKYIVAWVSIPAAFA